MKYSNGNAEITIKKDGTRFIQFENELQLDYPLNVDIRVSTKCAFGLNPITKTSFCSFCHESAKTDGEECDFSKLQEKLTGLPKGIELAVGSNELTSGLVEFLNWAKKQKYIVNLTVNQGHLGRDGLLLKKCIEKNLIKGIGISYRSSLKWSVPNWILEYPNTLFHVIAGIDSFEDVATLPSKGVKKLLVLGEKDFGFNEGRVNLLATEHLHWLWFISKLFSKFDVVSFDNLALEQMKIRRFFNDTQWSVFNQGEHSIYIDAVSGHFKPSSRSHQKDGWDSMSLKDYFQNLI